MSKVKSEITDGEFEKSGRRIERCVREREWGKERKTGGMGAGMGRTGTSGGGGILESLPLHHQNWHIAMLGGWKYF